MNELDSAVYTPEPYVENDAPMVIQDGRECRNGRVIGDTLLVCVSQWQPHFHIWESA